MLYPDRQPKETQFDEDPALSEAVEAVRYQSSWLMSSNGGYGDTVWKRPNSSHMGAEKGCRRADIRARYKSMNTIIAPFAYAMIAITAIVAGGCAAPQNLQASKSVHNSHSRDRFLLVEGSSDAIGSNGVLLEAVGMEVQGGTFLTILPKGCRLPCAVNQNFSAREPAQTQIGFHLFRGNSTAVSGAHALGTVHITGFSPTSNGNARVVVRFVADSSGISLSAKNAALDIVAP
jgi:Hsp70 protein